jgi:hypothetical protein
MSRSTCIAYLAVDSRALDFYTFSGTGVSPEFLVKQLRMVTPVYFSSETTPMWF